MKKHLALFDFDGTITTVDTLPTFIRFYHGDLKFFLGLVVLSPMLVCHFLKLIPNWRSKEILLTWFFKGEDIHHFNRRCQEFALVANKYVRPGALEKIHTYQQNKDSLIVVSASPENWVRPWCDQYNITCLATKLEVISQKLTGKLDGRNCYGPEKESRIREKFDLTTFDEISAYGDSSGDREMLALATQKFFRPFRD